MRKWSNIEKDIDRLHQKKFGRRRTQQENLKKLCEEIGELTESVMNGKTKEIEKEAADCIISIITVLQTHRKSSYAFLDQIVDDKLDELYERNKIDR